MRGSVQKKGKRFYIVYTIDKRQRWEKVPDPNTKANAEKILAERVASIYNGKFRQFEPITFRGFAEIWIGDYVNNEHHIKYSTAGNYRSIFKNHLMPHFGDQLLASITPDMVQALVTKLSKQGKTPQTVRGQLIPLSTMFRHAIKRGHIESSPMLSVDKPKVRRKKMSFLTAGEMHDVLEQIPEEWYAFFLTAGMTGARLGELLAMRWANLNEDSAQYAISERLYNGKFDTPKSDASVRLVDLAPRVLSCLKSHRAKQNMVKLEMGAKYEDEDLIFCMRSGTPIKQPQFLREEFQEALSRAGCPRMRLHDVRHSYASLLIAQGASPKYIQQQLGHTSISTTFDIYGSLLPSAGEEIVKGLEEQIFGAK